MRRQLVDDDYLTQAEWDTISPHLLVGKVSESDSLDTVLIISDNFPESPVAKEQQVQHDDILVFTKGGNGKMISPNDYPTEIKELKLPALLQ